MQLIFDWDKIAHLYLMVMDYVKNMSFYHHRLCRDHWVAELPSVSFHHSDHCTSTNPHFFHIQFFFVLRLCFLWIPIICSTRSSRLLRFCLILSIIFFKEELELVSELESSVKHSDTCNFTVLRILFLGDISPSCELSSWSSVHSSKLSSSSDSLSDSSSEASCSWTWRLGNTSC